jgi:hypothetical protein
MPKWGWWLLGSMILFVTVVTIVIIILIRKSDDDSSPEGAGPVGPAPTSSGPAPTSSGPAPTSSGPAPTSSGPGPTSPGPGPTSSDPDNTTPIGPGNAQCIMDSSLSNCYSINTESYDYSSIRGPNVPVTVIQLTLNLMIIVQFVVPTFHMMQPGMIHHTPIITGTFIIMDGMARPTRAGLITVLPVVANRRTITRKIGTVVTS